MKKTINVDEWLTAFEQATKSEPGDTIQEISDRIGKPHSTTKEWLNRMVAQGKAKKGWGFRGNAKPVRVYQMIKAEKV